MSDNQNILQSSIIDDLKDHLPKIISEKLKDHQVNGIKFVLSKFEDGVILAHSMGNTYSGANIFKNV